MKFMNMKRFGSTVMAGALALSLATPAFAASNTSTTITGTYADIPIAVEVPTTGAAQINPYGLPVTITKSNDTTVDLVGQQITTRPLSVKNQGTVKLDMGVSSFMVVPKGDLSITGTAFDPDTNTGKEVDVSLQVAGLNDTTLAVSSDNENLENLIIDAFAKDDNWDGAAALRAPAAAKGAAASAITAAKQDGMAVLGAVTAKAEGFTYGKNSIALFRLTGELAQEPVDSSSAADPWKEADGFSATIVFKFVPHSDVDASVSLDQPTLSLGSGTANLVATFAANDTDLTVTSWAWTTSDATVANTNGTNTSANAVIAYVGAGTATITATATLSDGSTRIATCNVTCS